MAKESSIWREQSKGVKLSVVWTGVRGGEGAMSVWGRSRGKARGRTKRTEYNLGGYRRREMVSGVRCKGVCAERKDRIQYVGM